MKSKFYVIGVFMIFFSTLSSQDIHFSQLSQSQFFSNPAFAGIQFGPRLLAHYRNEYPQVGQTLNAGYNTYYISYDQFMNDYNSGLGVQMIYDQFGDKLFSRYHLNLNYAYQARFDETQALRIGLSGALIHQQIDKSKLLFFDQIHPINGFNQSVPTNENLENNFSLTNLNLNFGLLYFMQNIYIGASARNLLAMNNFFPSSQTPLKDLALSVQAGGVIWLNKDKRTAIFPYLLYDRQYDYQKLSSNVLFQYQVFNLGIGFRHNISNLESIMVISGFNFKKIRLSYSYDIVQNQIKSYSGGSHEVGIRFLIKGDDNSLHPNEYKNVTSCPEFLKN